LKNTLTSLKVSYRELNNYHPFSYNEVKRGEFMNNAMGNFYNNYPYIPYPKLKGYMDYNSRVYGQTNNCYCEKSFLRILNSCADTALDVHVNEVVMAENLKEGEFTRYAQVSPKQYEIRIFNSDEPKELIFESSIDISRNMTYTGVIAEDDSDPADISVLMIPEAKENYMTGKMSSIRFANLAFGAPDLELAADDGTVLFAGIKYSDVSSNVAIPSGLYNLTLREKGSKKEVKAMDVDFAPGMHYTMFASGKYGEDINVDIIIPEDGVNYLGLC